MMNRSPKRLYFLAVIPPNPIQSEIMEKKKTASKLFNSSHSLNSPAHITLIPPFYANDTEIKKFNNAFKEFVSSYNPIKIDLKDFNKFGNRVIFVDVLPNEELNALQKDLFRLFKKHFPKYKKDNRFHPHVTVAFKDLREEVFQKAWEYFNQLPYKAHFIMNHIYLLKHENKKWQVVEKYALNKISRN